MQGGSPANVDGNNLPKVAATVASINSQKSPSVTPGSPMAATPEPEAHGPEKGNNSVQAARPVARGQHVAVPRGRGRGISKNKVSLQLGRSKSDENGGWTGAGFDVDDGPS